MIHFKPFKFGKAELGVITVFFVLFALGVGITSIPLVATIYGRLTNTWMHAALQYGYVGAFGAALIGSTSATVFFPYTIIVFFLATQGLSPFWLGVLMGLGAGIGQMFGYIIGRWGSAWFHRKKPETYDAMERILHRRPGLITLFLIIFGSTPLPDDLIMIPLGMLQYSWWKTWLPSTIGKIFAGWIVTYSSFFISRSLDTSVAAGASGLVTQFITVAGIAVVAYIMFRLDWQKIMHRLLNGQSSDV
ncbi:MAG: VTT domain-containing protein [Patescibacteria group bacterium]